MITENKHQETLYNKRATTKKSILIIFPQVITALLWLLFIGNLVYLLYYYPNLPELAISNLLKVNGFTVLIWTTVTFFAGLIGSFACDYLKGFRYRSKFMARCMGFTLAVMFFVMSEHLIILLLSWLAMGVFMSQLIGIDASRGNAREAALFASRYFVTGSLCLSAGVILLAVASDSYTLSGILGALDDLPSPIVFIAALFIIVSAIAQSAIYPFHRWLLSAMTAPTPASALMHAGFVNGAGILLTLFSTLMFASNTLDILLIIGGLTAIIAQFTKLLQVNIKQKLACSTIAQMGFMIMQCGLGFFNAAVTHLILHGFYKAYLFLSSGEQIVHSKPEKPPKISIGPLQAFLVLIFATIGAILFVIWTGKGMRLDSGIFLTLIVTITVGQITYNIVKERSLNVWQKWVLPPALYILGIGAYAFMYNAITLLMSDMPMVAQSLPISITQVVFGIVFLIGFFIMKLGIYRKVPWLYVKLMNLSQPAKKTILMFKSNS